MEAAYKSKLVNAGRKELRLLTIDPISNEEQLRCNLNTFSLLHTTQAYGDFLSDRCLSTDNPTATLKAWHGVEQMETFPNVAHHRYQWGDYAALSYVWGDPSDTTCVLVNGVETQITKNLSGALRLLRETGQFGDRFRLWVDALCINQNDREECSEQVALMRFFYVRAWSVIGYLGPPAGASDKAIDLLGTLAEISDSHRKCEELREDMAQHNFHHTPGSWLALNRLLQRPYWERLWIMQELALGGARMTLICGAKQISWQSFCRGIGVIHSHLWIARNEAITRDRQMEVDPRDTCEWDPCGPLNHIYKDIWMLTQNQEFQSNPPKFSRLLEMANSCHCLDDRDKVYGMLGIMDPKLANAIQPDYKSDTATVFTRTAEAYISVYSDLELLRDANTWGEAGAPSWVPDWTWARRGRDCQPDDWFHPENVDNPLVPMERRPYRASGGLQFMMPRFDRTYLGCHGVIFDYVDGLGCNPEVAGANPDIVQSQGITSAYGSFEDTSKQLGTALYAGRRRAERHAPVLLHLPITMEEAKKQFLDVGWKHFIQDLVHYHRWIAWYESNASLLVGGRELREYFDGKIETGADMLDYWSAHHAWVRTALAGNRRLVTTTAGRLGWVPCASNNAPGDAGDVRRGDAFAVFPGCSTPILLRSANEKGMFRVIGEAYVHGVMEGEIQELLARNEYQLQQLWLC